MDEQLYQSTKDTLYAALVALCQDFGFTTEHTYECLQNAVDSIVVDPDLVDADQ